MRGLTIIVLSALSAVASAIHAFSRNPDSPPPAWRNFESDDSVTLINEGAAFWAFLTQGGNENLVLCWELYSEENNMHVYANAETLPTFEERGFERTNENFWIYESERPDTVRLYQTRKAGGEYLYTTSATEATSNQFEIQSVVGWVYPGSINDSVPFPRWNMF